MEFLSWIGDAGYFVQMLFSVVLFLVIFLPIEIGVNLYKRYKNNQKTKEEKLKEFVDKLNESSDEDGIEVQVFEIPVGVEVEQVDFFDLLENAPEMTPEEEKEYLAKYGDIV